MQNVPGAVDASISREINRPELRIKIYREKAAALGVSAQAIGRTLETMFGSRRATTYLRGGQEYDVILQTDRDNRREVADLEALYVATGAGQLVPLSAVVTTKTSGDTPHQSPLPSGSRQRYLAVTLPFRLYDPANPSPAM